MTGHFHFLGGRLPTLSFPLLSFLALRSLCEVSLLTLQEISRTKDFVTSGFELHSMNHFQKEGGLFLRPQRQSSADSSSMSDGQTASFTHHSDYRNRNCSAHAGRTWVTRKDAEIQVRAVPRYVVRCLFLSFPAPTRYGSGKNWSLRFTFLPHGRQFYRW